MSPAGGGRRRLRGCLLNLALVGVTGFVTLGAVEMVLRLSAHRILPEGEWLSTASIFRPLEKMGIGLKPGSTRLLVTGGAYTARDRINTLGTRGPLPAEGRLPGTRRILVLGDSFVFGQGVAVEDALPALLEDLVDSTEVINAGIPGYTLGQEYVFYREELRRFRPDLVLVGFFMNDLDETRYLELVRDDRGVPVTYTMKEDARLRKEARRHAGWSSRASTWMKGRSLLYTLVRNRIDSMRYRASAPRGGAEEEEGEGPLDGAEPPTYMRVFRVPPPMETLDRWAHAWSTLDALNDLVTRDGARMLIFSIPADWQTSPAAMEAWARFYGVDPGEVDRELPQKMLQQWSARSGVPFVNLLPVFEGRDPREVYFSHDLHWNEVGHALAAGTLLRALEETGLLQEPAP